MELILHFRVIMVYVGLQSQLSIYISFMLNFFLSPFPLPSSLSLGVFEDRRSAFANGPIKYFNSILY